MNEYKEKKGTSFPWTIIIQFLAGIAAFLCVVFFTVYVTSKVSTEAFDVCSEIAESNALTLQARIVAQFDEVKALALSLSRTESEKILEGDGIYALLSDTVDSTSLSALFYIGSDGFYRDKDGIAYDCSHRNYYLNGINGYSGIEYVEKSVIGGEPSLVFAAPVYDSDEHRVVGILAGVYPSGNVRQIIKSTNGIKSYSFIIDRSGGLAFGDKGDSIIGNNNYLKVENGTETAFDEKSLLAEIADSKSGAVRYSSDETEYYAFYEPIIGTRWTLVQVVRCDEICALTFPYLLAGVIMTAILLCLGSFVFIIFFRDEAAKLKVLRDEKERLRLNQEMYKIVQGFSDDVLFQGSYSDEKITYTGSLENQCDVHPFFHKLSDFGQANPRIHRDDFTEWLIFAEKIRNLAESDTAEIRIQNASGEYVWLRITYNIVFLDNGTPERIIGRIRNVNAEKSNIEMLKKAARTDAVTRLLNLGAFMDDIGEFLSSGGADGHCAFIAIGFPALEYINEHYGYSICQSAQAKIGEIISATLRKNQFACRVSDSEFAVFLQSFDSEAGLRALLDDMSDRLQISYICLGNVVTLSCNLGVSTSSPAHPCTAAQLYYDADKALKSLGTERLGLFAVYSSDSGEGRREPTAETSGVQYRALLDNLDGGIMLLELREDTVGALYISPSYYKMAKVTPSFMLDYYNDIGRLLSPTDRESVREQLIACEPNQSFDYSYRMSFDGESFRWHSIRMVRIRYENSENPVYLGIIFDITDSRLSAVRYGALLNSLPCGISILRGEANALPIEYHNPAMLEIVGCTEAEFEQFVQPDLSELIALSDREKAFALIAESVRTGEKVSGTFRTKDSFTGYPSDVLCYVVPIEGGGDTPRLLMVVYDITAELGIRSELSEKSSRLALSNGIVSLAFSQLDTMVWVYYPRSHTVYSWDIENSELNKNRFYEDVPNSLTAGGFLDLQSEKVIEKMMKSIDDGISHNSCPVKIKLKSAERAEWHNFSYSMVESEGEPLCVCVTRRIPNAEYALMLLRQEEGFMSLVNSPSCTVLRVNMTKNVVEFADFAAATPFSTEKLITYEEYLELLMDDYQQEDKAAYRTRVSRAAILRAYSHGKTSLFNEFQYKTSNGKTVWLTNLTVLLGSPITDEVFAYIYVFSNDYSRRVELTSGEPERSIINSLYSSRTFIEYAGGVIAAAAPTDTAALILLSFDGIGQIRDALGFDFVNRLSLKMAQYLKIRYSGRCLIGVYSDGQVSIFLPTVENYDEAAEKAREIVAALIAFHEKMGVSEIIKVYAAAVSARCGTAGVHSMLERAEKSVEELRKVQRSGGVFSEELAAEQARPELSDVPGGENEDGSLFEVLFECSKLLLMSGSYQEGVRGVLRRIAGLYSADRAYLINVAENNAEAEYFEEWDAKGENPNKGRAFLLESFPTAQRAFVSNVPFVKAAAGGEAVVNDVGAEFDSFILYPLEREGKVCSLLCIESPRGYNFGTRLPALIAPLLVVAGSKTEIEAYQRQLSYFDSLTSALNRNSFIGYVERANKRSLSSLGIMMVDVNAMKHINVRFGSRYGDELLINIASITREIFGADYVYRVSGDEFVSFSENLSRSEFTEKVMKLKEKLELSQPLRSCVVWLWEDYNINVQDMIEHCFVMVSNEKQAIRYRRELSGNETLAENAEKLKSALNGGWFQIYLQPKKSTESGKISGAEVLVRCIDSDSGEIITPDRFIPALEQQNTINLLDLYVVEETLKLMRSWIDRGASLFPVSINLSRKTLITPDTLNALIELHERYHIPREMFELEITDSIGMLERASIIKICEQYKEKGFRFTLDDFGSNNSSVSFMTSIPFEVIKLDRSLIGNMLGDRASRVVCESIARYCRELGIECVAEGVETEEQLNAVKELGCDVAQGYLFDKPIPIREFEEKYIAFAEE